MRLAGATEAGGVCDRKRGSQTTDFNSGGSSCKAVFELNVTVTVLTANVFTIQHEGDMNVCTNFIVLHPIILNFSI